MSVLKSSDGYALSQLMPMHLVLSPTGIIVQIGPAMDKVRPRKSIIGRRFEDVFELRRPRGMVLRDELTSKPGGQLHLSFIDPPQTQLRGVWVRMADGCYVVNLSFGIGVVQAVADYNLKLADFAATDLAVEMLYLVEAKSAVMGELHNLNARVENARIMAEERARTDELTGLQNRRAVDQALDQMIAAGRPFSLMHIDLDYFKAVNDTHGHAAGDHVLMRVAQVLTSETRSRDCVGRVGGDEFVILLDNLVEMSQLEKIAARIISRLEEPVNYAQKLCQISASIGTALSIHYTTPNASEMMADADMALYQSKRDGRSRATFVTEQPSTTISASGVQPSASAGVR